MTRNKQCYQVAEPAGRRRCAAAATIRTWRPEIVFLNILDSIPQYSSRFLWRNNFIASWTIHLENMLINALSPFLVQHCDSSLSNVSIHLDLYAKRETHLIHLFTFPEWYSCGVKGIQLGKHSIENIFWLSKSSRIGNSEYLRSVDICVSCGRRHEGIVGVFEWVVVHHLWWLLFLH